MTAMIPDQLRDHARRIEAVLPNAGLWQGEDEDIEQAAAALRAAADQLDALQETIGIYRGDNTIEAHWLVGRLDMLLAASKGR